MIAFVCFLKYLTLAILRAKVVKYVGLIGQPADHEIHSVEWCTFLKLFELYKKGYKPHLISLEGQRFTQINLKALKEV